MTWTLRINRPTPSQNTREGQHFIPATRTRASGGGASAAPQASWPSRAPPASAG